MNLAKYSDEIDITAEDVIFADKPEPERLGEGTHRGWITKVELTDWKEVNDKKTGEFVKETQGVRITIKPEGNFYPINHWFNGLFTTRGDSKVLNTENGIDGPFYPITTMLSWLRKGGLIYEATNKEALQRIRTEGFDTYMSELIGAPLQFTASLTTSKGKEYVNCTSFSPWVEGNRVAVEETPF